MAIIIIAAGCGSTNPFKDNLFKTELPAKSNSATSEIEWNESYDEALQQASVSGKPILVDFTGSGWCVWCDRLSEEVFDKPSFENWAKENVVLLELDYPRDGSQSPSLKKQNAKLAKKYSIDSYPSVLFLDAQGGELGRTGYVKGGPSSFIKTAEQILNGKVGAP